MGRLVLRRLLSIIPVLLIVSFAIFFLLALVPGDPAVTLAGGVSATPAEIARVTGGVAPQRSIDRPVLALALRSSTGKPGNFALEPVSR